MNSHPRTARMFFSLGTITYVSWLCFHTSQRRTPHLTPSCFSLPASEQEVSLYGQSLSQLLQEKLKDTEEAGAKKALTDLQVVVLWTRRFFGFVVFGLWQCSSYAVIIYLTVNTVEVQRIVSEVSFLRTLAGSIPSLAVTIINAMSPAIIGK
jgi:hypothetical protein